MSTAEPNEAPTPDRSGAAALDPDLRGFLARPEGWAVFLDVDGTLLDIAPTPESVVVPKRLADDLARLSARVGGALALVSGRAVAFIDALFGPHRFAVAGLHGAERRTSDGRIEEATAGPELVAIKRRLAAEATGLAGVIFEDKGAAVALHYRQAPDFKDTVRQLMDEAAASAGAGYSLQPGKMVVELRPRASKGDALQNFMQEEVFKGRRPLVFGDDVTDEAMFKVANRLGGVSVKIGGEPCETTASTRLENPQAVRELIAAAAEG